MPSQPMSQQGTYQSGCQSKNGGKRSCLFRSERDVIVRRHPSGRLLELGVRSRIVKKFGPNEGRQLESDLHEDESSGFTS
jgi:hypothetical protein